MFEIKDLRIYKKSLELVKEIYLLIEKNPKLSKDFSLCDQIKRASVSIPANISEGFFRSKKQTKNYLEIASGSAN
jgi:four helix bundle protein